MSANQTKEVDVVLVGAGIMSATLGVLLKELNSNCKIEIFEKLDKSAQESSDAWNNAGTGHSAFCELNYTPETKNGVDVSKAINICEQFDVSRQFWSYLVKKEIVKNPRSFINTVPHMSFVWGESGVNYLRKRYEALKNIPLFQGMEYTENPEQIEKWAPLIMKGRGKDEQVAATNMPIGTDVNFGELTRSMIAHLSHQPEVRTTFGTEVYDVKKQSDGRWKVFTKDTKGHKRVVITKFIFVGAGGASVLLLKKSQIPEGKYYGGFPVGGQWLICQNEELVNQHNAKVYGRASVGAPPMSVPHLDTRYIDGKKSLLFGPYAGFSTKFLKHGSDLDLFKSVTFSNVGIMLAAGLKNLDLTQYLIKEVLQSQENRVKSLKEYFRNAKAQDWKLQNAGQRVQTIKKNANGEAEIAFGTEVVSSADGSFAVLLGASPGASTTVSIMLNLLNKCFADSYSSTEWKSKLKEMIPSFGEKLNDNPELLKVIRNQTAQVLELNEL